METLTEKIHIIEGSDTRGSVDLDSLINFPQVILPPKFKAPKFVKYDGIKDPCTHLSMFCRKMGTLWRQSSFALPNFPWQLDWPRSHMVCEIGKDLQLERDGQCIPRILPVQYWDSSRPHSSLEYRKEGRGIFPWVCPKVARASRPSASSYYGRKNDQMVHW